MSKSQYFSRLFYGVGSVPASVIAYHVSSDLNYRLEHICGLDDVKLKKMKKLIEQLPLVIITATANANFEFLDEFTSTWFQEVCDLNSDLFFRLAEKIKAYVGIRPMLISNDCLAKKSLVRQANVVASLVLLIYARLDDANQRNLHFSVWLPDGEHNYVGERLEIMISGLLHALSGPVKKGKQIIDV